MSARRITDDMLLALLHLLGPRFTVAELNRMLPVVGIRSRTQARYWLRHHGPGRPALVRVAARVHQPRGRPTIVYALTAYGQERLATRG